ncbi:MAG: DinB family protein, partial [Terriglobales bacterium]
MSKLERDLQYPIGPYEAPATISAEQRVAWIEELSKLPANLTKAVAALNEAQLDTPYRPGGWTVRQVVHHLPDSHLNIYTRFRLALTEDSPLIK